jgi:hypothetical protein
LARQLGDSARGLDGLRKKQEDLRRKLDELAASRAGDKQAELQAAARRQEEIRQETLRESRRLERLLAEDAARAAANAAEKMGSATRAGQQGATSGASRHAKDAEQLLADAADKLRAKRAELAAQLAVELQARLNDAVKHLHRQERRIEDETREFAALERSGPLSRAQVFGLTELARQQQLLREETDQLARTLGAASALRLGLSAAADEMRSAAGLLQEQQIGPATQQAEHAATDRLALLLAAMEPEKQDNTAQDNNSGDSSGGPGNPSPRAGGGPPCGMILLAEVKFLKLWQEDLNRRTQQVETDAARKLPEELRARYARLAEEQARLATAALRLRDPENTDADAQNADEPKKENRDGNEN